MKTRPEKFGLLLAHFFMGDKEAFSVSGAARLCGLGTGAARALLKLLAEEGVLRDEGTSRGRSLSAGVRGRGKSHH